MSVMRRPRMERRGGPAPALVTLGRAHPAAPHEAAAPMIELHYWPTPNGHKITMFLEEAGLPYRIVPVDISRGEQFRPEFLKIAPNNRMPAIVDHDPADEG